MAMPGILTSRATNATNKVVEQAFAEHGALLRAFVRKRTGMQDMEVDDVIQEVFLRLANKADLVERVQQGAMNIRPYLFNMTNNLLADLSRRKSVREKYREGQQLRIDQQSPEMEKSLEARVPESGGFGNPLTPGVCAPAGVTPPGSGTLLISLRSACGACGV